MFKSCCSKPNKKINKSKSKSDNIDKMQGSQSVPAAGNDASGSGEGKNQANSNKTAEEKLDTSSCSFSGESKVEDIENNKELDLQNVPESSKEAPSSLDKSNEDVFDQATVKTDLTKKRFSVDYKRSRHDFKRYSVDCRNDSATLEELSRLEMELARTNVDVRPPSRRKSVGILKSTTSYSDVVEENLPPKPESCSEDDEVFEVIGEGIESEGPRDPPATPVGRDELALRRHRFFSDLVSAARAAVEHRVRFDPLGPVVADTGSEVEPGGSCTAPASDLEALIVRLERVTSRLERLPQLRPRTPPHSPAPSPLATPPPSPHPSPLPSPPPSPPPAYASPADDMSVNGYQDLLAGPLKTYLDLSQKIGGDVATHAQLVNAAFQAQLRYIQLAATRGKPSQAEEMTLLAPTSDHIAAIQQFREGHRTSAYFNHLSAVSESVPALGWVAVAPTPAPHVKEMNDAGQFYTNRVLKEWREKDAKHAEWCRAWVQLLAELQAYVKKNHTTGLVWSGKGSGAGAPPPPPPGGMPPPPPCMPLTDFDNLSIDDRSALFAEINQGEGITSSLRKVTSEMQTHKNPTLRQGPAPFKASAPPARPAPSRPLPAPGAGAHADKPPVFMRDGKKWLIEYQRGNAGLVVENADMNNVVYMFRCRDSSLTVRGKVNGVVLDSCTKCAVVFDHLVSSVEFVNCQSVQMQVLGKVPTISIDKTDGCQIYLSPESLDVEIISSKSSEMNVLVPKGNGDYVELPVPEQFKTLVNKARSGLATAPVESTG